MISEPTTLASDWLLAAVAAALARRLLRAGQPSPSRRLWAAAFLAGALAALAGGAVHGFAAWLSPPAHGVLWRTVLVAAGLAGSLILAGLVLATLGGPRRTAALAAAGLQLGTYLALVSVSSDVRLAVWNGAVTIAGILVLALAAGRRDPGLLALVLLALALSAAALAVQRSGVGAVFLNHNDICHVLQTAALWPFYRAGLRLPPLRGGRSSA
jgi:hypothetical protein